MAARVLLAAALLLAFGRSAYSAGGGSGSPWSVARSADREWTVTYVRPVQPRANVVIGGVTHLVFGPPFHPASSAEGSPGLPVEEIALGVPHGCSVTAKIEDADVVDEQGRAVAPVPALVTAADGRVSYEYRKAPAAYVRPGLIPATPLQMDAPFVFRGLRVVTLRIAPVQYDASAGTLRTLRRARIVVSYSGGSTAPAPAVSDPGGALRSLIANYDEARLWRIAPPPLQKASLDSTRIWFEKGRPYAKVSVTRDGWYRIAKRTLEAVLGSGVAPGSVTLQYRGRPAPVFVRGDSAVEFYGERLRGDSTFVNDITDTNAYWLSTVPSQPFHFQPEAPIAAPADTVRTSAEPEHIEENHTMYVGTTEAEIISSASVPGRGWVWEFLYPGGTTEKRFTLDTLDAGQPASIAVRLFSTTLHYSTPDHRARFWVNDSLAGEIGFNGRSEAVFRAPIPASVLRQGANRLRISSLSTASFPNQFYLDWFEVTRRRPLVATGDLLRFTAEPGPTAPRAFVLENFGSADVEVFDLTAGRKIVTVNVVPDGRGRFRCVFVDTLTSVRRYMALTPSAAQDPDDVRRRVFADHRDNSRGADYVVVAHRIFTPVAVEHAAHREATNGVRSAVVDVEDLYDEFAYGRKTPWAIKDFLRYAFVFWPAPHPSSVLLFGDACYDSKSYDSTTVKSDLVPTVGMSASDNWFVCFDDSLPFLPSLMLGRLPVENAAQASAVAAKLRLYDAYQPAAWNKRFLFITGGNSESEQTMFDQMSSQLASGTVAPAPIGGEILHIGKTTSSVIDGDSRTSIKELVRQGLVHMNFLGHSGGRIWNVDVGDPAEFENTGGQWPFITSVSCNVGSFASSFQNCLAEDFLFPDKRGAIAVWGSSSLGYAYFGTTLVQYLLDEVRRDTLRELGALTTIARIRLWQAFGTSPVSVAHVNLTPLIGDPLTRLALPVRPDLAVGNEDLLADRTVATAADTSLRYRAVLHNYGLVPPDSVEVAATDAYGSSAPSTLLAIRRPPLVRSDTVDFRLKTFDRAGHHTVRVALDPAGRIAEVQTTNNAVTTDVVVYSSSVRAVRPFDNAVVPPGPQQLVIAVPGAGGSGDRSARFELDTLPTFLSPGKIVSGPIVPGPVAARWVSPSLPSGGTYFWRGRIDIGNSEGAWTSSSFSMGPDTLQKPFLRWRQATRGQFERNLRNHVTWSDSGMMLGAPDPLRLYARSLGARSTVNGDQFSAIRVNDETTLGYWWVMGYGLMAARIDPLTGLYELRSFDIGYKAGDADSLASFVASTPQGRYLVFAIIVDGVTNATERYYQALESVGSTRIRQLKAGDAWIMITRKGAGVIPGLPSERVSTDGLVADSVEVPVRFGAGTMEAMPMVRAAAWRSIGTEGAGSGARIALAGRRTDGSDDSLFVTPLVTGEADLHGLNAAGIASTYRWVRPVVSMSTSDPLMGPVVKRWWIDLSPAADLAMGAAVLAWANDPHVDPGLSVQVFNIGFQTTDTASCIAWVGDGLGWTQVAKVAVPPVVPDSSLSLAIRIPRTAIPSRAVLRVSLVPGPGKVDLIDENNLVELPVSRENPLSGRIQVIADDAEVLDGDYLAASPALRIRVPGRAGVTRRTIRGSLDGTVIAEATVRIDTLNENPAVDELAMSPSLGRGTHEIRTWVMDEYALGAPDTSSRSLMVKVADELRIMNLFNYPNPFGARTEFTFTLSGSRAPERGKISVYTIAGRKIRQIELDEVRIGFNRFAWDGRDDDGDEIGNGTYLYRLEVTAGEDRQVAGGKLVRVR